MASITSGEMTDCDWLRSTFSITHYAGHVDRCTDRGSRATGGARAVAPAALTVRERLVAPFCDNKRIKALTNKILLLTCRHMYLYAVIVDFAVIGIYHHVHFISRITQATLIVLLVI
jgi:hypothetical protein